MNLQDKIAKAKQQLAATEPLKKVVELGGEPTTIDIYLIESEDWQDLVATNPPRHGSTGDDEIGYNADAVTAAYPLSALTVDGEHVEQDVWLEMLSHLSGPSRTDIAHAIYEQNHLYPALRLAMVGKAFRDGAATSSEQPAS